MDGSEGSFVAHPVATVERVLRAIQKPTLSLRYGLVCSHFRSHAPLAVCKIYSATDS
jgi:hypothetical protein